MKEILDVIHKTIYQFFDVCGDDEEVPISDKDKLLLEVNKSICNNIKALEQESTTKNDLGVDALEAVNNAYWIDNHNRTISCSHCHTWFYKDDRYSYMRYCPYCNKKMAESESKE